MALPSAFNQLSIINVQTEFGGSNPAALSEYYKNGSYVLFTDNAPNVPTIGMIKLSNFHSAARIVSTSHVLTEAGSGGAILGYGVAAPEFPGEIVGSVLSPTTTISGITIKAFFKLIVKGFTGLYLQVDGDQRISTVGNWWTSGTYGDIDTAGNTAFFRSSFSTPDGDYDAANNMTRWVTTVYAQIPDFSGAKTDRLILYV